MKPFGFPTYVEVGRWESEFMLEGKSQNSCWKVRVRTHVGKWESDFNL